MWTATVNVDLKAADRTWFSLICPVSVTAVHPDTLLLWFRVLLSDKCSCSRCSSISVVVTMVSSHPRYRGNYCRLTLTWKRNHLGNFSPQKERDDLFHSGYSVWCCKVGQTGWPISTSLLFKHAAHISPSNYSFEWEVYTLLLNALHHWKTLQWDCISALLSEKRTRHNRA